MSQTSRQYQRPRWLQSIYPFTSSTSNLQCWNIFRYVSKCLQTYSVHFKIRHGKCTDMLDRNRMKHKVKNAAVTRWTKDSRKSRGGVWIALFLVLSHLTMPLNSSTGKILTRIQIGSFTSHASCLLFPRRI